MGVFSDVSADDTARLQIQHASIRGPTHEITPQDMKQLLQMVSKERLVYPPTGPTQASADLLVEGDTIIFDPKTEADPLGIRGCEIQIPHDAANRLTFAFGGQPVLVGGADDKVADLPIIGFRVPNGPQYNALAHYGVTLPGCSPPNLAPPVASPAAMTLTGVSSPAASPTALGTTPKESHARKLRLGRTQAVTVNPSTARTQEATMKSREPTIKPRDVVKEVETRYVPQVQSKEDNIKYIVPHDGTRAQNEYYKMYEQEYRAQSQELRQRRRRRVKRDTKLETRPSAAACGIERPAVGSLMGAALQATQAWLTGMTGSNSEVNARQSSHDERKRRVLDAARSGSQMQAPTKRPSERGRRDHSTRPAPRKSVQPKEGARRSASRIPAPTSTTLPEATALNVSPRTRGPPPGAAVSAAYDAAQMGLPLRTVASPTGNYMLPQKEHGRGTAPVRAGVLMQRPPPLMRSQDDLCLRRSPIASAEGMAVEVAERSASLMRAEEVDATPRMTQPARASEALMAAERDLMVHLIGRQVAAKQLRETIAKTTAELGLKHAPSPEEILNLDNANATAVLTQMLSQARTEGQAGAQIQDQQLAQTYTQKQQAPTHSLSQQQYTQTAYDPQGMPQHMQQKMVAQTSAEADSYRNNGVQNVVDGTARLQMNNEDLGAMPQADDTASLCDRGFLEAGRDETHTMMRLPEPNTSVKFRVKNPATGESREVEVVSVCRRPEIQLVRNLLSEVESKEVEELMEDIQSLPHLPQNLLDNDALDHEDMNMIKTIVSRVASMTDVGLEDVLAVCPSTVEFTAKDQTKEFSSLIRIYVDEIHEEYSSIFPALGVTLKPRRGYALRWTCVDTAGRKDTRSEHQEVIAPGKRRLMLTIYVK